MNRCTMHLRSLTVAGLLAAGLAAGTVVAIAQGTGPVPAGIVLDGVTTILGDHRACFKVTFTAGAAEVGFMLAEGQARYGIKLLAVDARLNAVTISNQGLTQIIPICKTPTLLATATADGNASIRLGGRDNPGTVFTGNVEAQGNETQPAVNGQFPPGYAIGPGGLQNGSASGNNNDFSGNTDNSTDNSSNGSSAGAGDNTSHTQLYQWWVKEAEKIERARIETASRVMAGEWPPYPLTPLTPPNTLPQLIGPGSLYMNHGPGILISSN
jgi:hypothetical protein